MILHLLFEGFESAVLPCSLVLLIPGIAAVLSARQEASVAAAGFVGAAIIGSWLRLSDRIGDPPAVFVALAFMGALILLVFPLVRRLTLVSLSGGVLAGLASSALWQPCVGENFGNLLGELPGRGIASGAVLTAAYMVGVLAPVIALAALLEAIPGPLLLPARPFMLFSGGLAMVIISATVAANLHDEVISRLVAWSL